MVKNKNSIKVAIITLATTLMMATSSIVIYANVSQPKFYEYFIDTGNKYLEKGKYKEAILSFDKAIKIEEKSTEARVYLAQGYIGNEELDKAVDTLEEAQNIDKTNDNLLIDILELINDVDSNIAYEFLNRYLNSVDKNSIPDKIKEILALSQQNPTIPIVNPAPGEYAKSISISLKQDKMKVGHSYYYTLDGSEPTLQSNKYNGKIDISESKTIKLIGYNKNGDTTEIFTLEYIIDKSIVEEIEKLIEVAQNLNDNTQTGTNVGDCIDGAKEELISNLKSIRSHLDDDILSCNQANDLKKKLETAIEAFNEKIIVQTDRQQLKVLIEKASKLHSSSTEGNKSTDYRVGSKKILLDKINEGKKIYDYILSKQNDIDNEVVILEKAIKTFENSKNVSIASLRNKYLNRIKELEYKSQMYSEWPDDMSHLEFGAKLEEIATEYEVLLANMGKELKGYLVDDKIIILNQFIQRWPIEKQKIDKDIEKQLESTGGGNWDMTSRPMTYAEALNKLCYELINTLLN